MEKPQHSDEPQADLTGAMTDEEFAASVAALRASMEEARQGRTRPLREVLDELGRNYEGAN